MVYRGNLFSTIIKSLIINKLKNSLNSIQIQKKVIAIKYGLFAKGYFLERLVSGSLVCSIKDKQKLIIHINVFAFMFLINKRLKSIYFNNSSISKNPSFLAKSIGKVPSSIARFLSAPFSSKNATISFNPL